MRRSIASSLFAGLALVCLLAAVGVHGEARPSVRKFSELKMAIECTIRREQVLRAHAGLHFHLFSMTSKPERSLEDIAELDSLMYEHNEAHDEWRDICGAGGGGGQQHTASERQPGVARGETN